MSRNMTQGSRSPLARISRRVAAIDTDCNYAQARVASLQHTTERF